MHVHELQKRFSVHRNYVTDNVNELLDFAKKIYITNEITTSEYKKLVRELESQGAKIPHDNLDLEELSQTGK